ncbi:hypothetical protein [Rhizobium phage RHph_X2_26]|nr:hypothetical protein [Rhizobium phage RHph_X2_26]
MRPGAVRYRDSDGQLVTVEPGDVLYSSALMAAGLDGEYWNGSQWARPDELDVRPPGVDGWIYEDELPPGYPYDAMFPFSKVDGVRMFPAVL